jgi:DNA-binding NtrC family response regulator
MVSALVIESEPKVAEQLCHLLELLDVNARPAYNVKAAWLGMNRSAPDLVFLSTTFPEEGWTSLVDGFCHDPRLENVPVVIVTPGVDPCRMNSRNILDVIERPATLEAIETSLQKAGLC